MHRPITRLLPKKIIFASSPPSSMTASAFGTFASTAAAVAKTSCTNGMPVALETPRPAEPVMAAYISAPPTTARASSSCSAAFSRTREKWRSYFLNTSSPLSLSMAVLTVVEPMSIPILYAI